MAAPLATDGLPSTSSTGVALAEPQPTAEMAAFVGRFIRKAESGKLLIKFSQRSVSTHRLLACARKEVGHDFDAHVDAMCCIVTLASALGRPVEWADTIKESLGDRFNEACQQVERRDKVKYDGWLKTCLTQSQRQLIWDESFASEREHGLKSGLFPVGRFSTQRAPINAKLIKAWYARLRAPKGCFYSVFQYKNSSTWTWQINRGHGAFLCGSERTEYAAAAARECIIDMCCELEIGDRFTKYLKKLNRNENISAVALLSEQHISRLRSKYIEVILERLDEHGFTNDPYAWALDQQNDDSPSVSERDDIGSVKRPRVDCELVNAIETRAAEKPIEKGPAEQRPISKGIQRLPSGLWALSGENCGFVGGGSTEEARASCTEACGPAFIYVCSQIPLCFQHGDEVSFGTKLGLSMGAYDGSSSRKWAEIFEDFVDIRAVRTALVRISSKRCFFYQNLPYKFHIFYVENFSHLAESSARERAARELGLNDTVVFDQATKGGHVTTHRALESYSLGNSLEAATKRNRAFARSARRILEHEHKAKLLGEFSIPLPGEFGQGMSLKKLQDIIRKHVELSTNCQGQPFRRPEERFFRKDA